MTRRSTFDDALDSAIESLLDGTALEDVLARYPEHAAALRPLLESAAAMSPRSVYEPPTDRLMAGQARIRAAVVAAREEALRDARTPWWRRRVAIASASVPVAAVVLGLGSALGVAGATVAMTTHLPADIATQIEQVTPEWSHALIPGGEHDASPGQQGGGVDPTRGPRDGSSTATPPNGAPIIDITVAGTITDVQGNVFDLTSPEGDYRVQVDSKTTVTGEILAGASATVEATFVSSNVLHATLVTVDATIVEPSQTEVAAADATPTAVDQPADTPTAPAIDPTSTPPGQSDSSRTPGRPETTRTPGAPAMPGNQGGTSSAGQGMQGMSGKPATPVE